MVHGAPDYSNVRKDVSIYRLDDMAELAVRLGSPDRWDRRGDVFHIQDFENGIATWDVVQAGGAPYPTLDTLTTCHGAYTMKMSTASGGGGYIHYRRGFPLTASDVLGFEFRYKVIDYAGKLQAWIDWYSGTELLSFWLQFNFVDEKLQYKDKDGNYQDLITDIKWDSTIPYWNYLKFVIDVGEREYVRVIYNEQTEQMAGIECYSESSDLNPFLGANLRFYDNGSGQGRIRVDSIILTANEA